MPFFVPGGPLRGDYDSVLLCTDLESDDVVTLKLLAPKLVDVPMLVVVGEGDQDKCQFAAQMLAAFGIGSSASVVQGQLSEEHYPTAALHSFASASSGAPARPAIITGDPCALVADFISTHGAPFALILKPPHELGGLSHSLTGKMVAAVYGSFNLTMFRVKLKGELTDEARLEQQETLLHSFKRSLWVERSLSVGRDCTLEPSIAPKIWEWINADAALVSTIRLWNATVLNGFTPKMIASLQEVSKMLQEGGEATPFVDIGQTLNGLDKKVQVMRSITRCEGQQVCHADTLVAAILLDADGVLAPFIHICRAGHDATGKPKALFDAVGDSALHVLYADDAQRRDLAAKSMEVLTKEMTAAIN